MPIKKSELDQVLRRSWAIPGLYRRGEAAFLYRLARRKGHIVEIGSWMGRTTSVLAQAVKVWHAQLTSVDPFTPMPPPHKQSSPERWRANLRKLGLEPPALMHLPSRKAAPLVPGPLSMVFIDGDHTRGAVAEDLADWAPKVQRGGVVALHDMFYPSIPGVAQAVTEWWAADRDTWAFIGLVDFTIAFKRTR